MEAGLLIRLGADPTALEQGMKVAVKSLETMERQLKVFQEGLKKATDPSRIGVLNRAITETKGRIDALKGVGRPFDGVKDSGNQATLAMMDLGRVIQDMPYGFRGIANNINPALESFQRLSRSAGGVGGALSSLGRSMLSGAGLGFAISIVTSLLAKFGDQMFANSEKAAKFTRELAGLNQRLEDTKSKLDEIRAALDFGNALANINAQVSGISAVTRLQGDAVALQQALFDVNQEISKIGQQIADPFRNAQQRKILDEGSDEEKEAAKKAEADLFKIYEDADKRRVDLENKLTIARRTIAAQKVDDQKKETEEQKKLLEKNLKDYKEYQKQLQQTLSEIAQLGRKYTNINFNQVPEIRTIIPPDASAKFREGLIEGLRKEYEKGIEVDLPVLDIDILQYNINRDNLFKAFEDLFGKGSASKVKIKKDMEIDGSVFKAGEVVDVRNDPRTQNAIAQAAILNQAKDQMGEMADFLNGTLTPAFQALFAEIGSGGANAFQAFGRAIQQAVQQMIAQLMALALISGITSLITGKSFGNLFSAGLGKMKIPGFAQGGIVPQGYPNDSYLARLSSNEAVIPLSNLPSMLGGNGGGGGGFIAETRISARDLRILLMREEKNKGGTW